MDDNCAAASVSCSSKRESDHYSEGLRDEELEMFLNSRYYFAIFTFYVHGTFLF